MERAFLEKGLEAPCRENPGEVRALTYGTKLPSGLKTLLFIDSAKFPSAFGLVNRPQRFWSAREFGAVGSSPVFSRFFSRHCAFGALDIENLFPCPNVVPRNTCRIRCFLLETPVESRSVWGAQFPSPLRCINVCHTWGGSVNFLEKSYYFAKKESCS